uniref:HSF-type DNA-binding domain-containing protein n=1 Tax=Periophthalmus magnuspinnatus TaxID=409849 RepID=A0A3B4AHC2_9GOBI
MSQYDYNLPETIDPSNFPAKLWRMVNNPANSAICWDKTGELILVNQQLFERRVLSSSNKEDEDNFESFKTTQFSSFVRQLNLYGFKKSRKKATVSHDDDDGDDDDADDADGDMSKSSLRYTTIHHFFNPSFRQNIQRTFTDLLIITIHWLCQSIYKPFKV